MTAMIASARAGGYEQELVDVFLGHAEHLLAGLDGPVDRATILALEPAPHATLDEDACEKAYLAIADMIDMRMPFTFGIREPSLRSRAPRPSRWGCPRPMSVPRAGRLRARHRRALGYPCRRG